MTKGTFVGSMLNLQAILLSVLAQGAPGVRVDGYFQPRLESTGDSAVFRFNTARVGVTGRVSTTVGFRGLFELLSGGEGAGETATVSAVDVYVEISHAPWTILAGQHKTPFVREFLINTPDLELPDLPVVVDQLATSRDLGVRVEWRRPGRVLLQGGVYNGEGRNHPRNDDGRMLLVGRGVVTPTPGLDLGAAVTSHGDDMRWGVEAALRRGRFEARAEYLSQELPGADARGWYGWFSWMVRPELVQLIGRVEQFDPDAALSGDQLTGFTAGAQWFVQGDRVKLQGSYTFVDEVAGDVANNRAVMQMQVRF